MSTVINISSTNWRAVLVAENLKVTHFNNGALSEDTAAIDVSTYGLLYNFVAVENEAGLCPAGWNVPTDHDFIELESHLGMSDETAQKNRLARYQ